MARGEAAEAVEAMEEAAVGMGGVQVQKTSLASVGVAVEASAGAAGAAT